jgi:hypothetical protein
MSDLSVVTETPQQRFDRLTQQIETLNGSVDPSFKALLKDLLGPAPFAVQPPVDADFLTPQWMQNEVYPAQLDRTLIGSVWPLGGSVGAGDLLVGPRAAGANLSVDVAAGAGVVIGTDSPGQGNYLCRLLNLKNRPLSAAPGAGLQRIDVVGLQVWDQAVIGATTNPPWNVVVLTGTAAATAAAPAYPNSFTPLAQIGPILSTTAQITAPLITDLRAPVFGGMQKLASIKFVNATSATWAVPSWVSQRYTGLRMVFYDLAFTAFGGQDTLVIRLNGDTVNYFFGQWYMNNGTASAANSGALGGLFGPTIGWGGWPGSGDFILTPLGVSTSIHTMLGQAAQLGSAASWIYGLRGSAWKSGTAITTMQFLYLNATAGSTFNGTVDIYGI